MADLSCLRCDSPKLNVLPESNDQITFYQCPSCLRQYAQRAGRTLCDRWLSPLGIVLYGIQFEPNPQAGAERVARSLLQQQKPEEITRMIFEIEAELQEPRQQVRDILDLPQAEEELRAFLRRVVEYWRAETETEESSGD
jgi:hypothetical protein